MNELPPEVASVVASSGLEVTAITQLAARIGHDEGRSNVIDGVVAPPGPEDVSALPDDASTRAQLSALGEAAVREGRVGLVVLNGGMATRFGGGVKGTVSVDGDRSFLALKLLDALRVARRLNAPPPPVILMNSRATTSATRRHLEENDYFGYPPAQVWMFEQHWAVRFTPDGDVFRDLDGAPSYYGPGHGDLVYRLGQSGILERFIAAGGETLLMSNVDNVTATLRMDLLGWHRARSEWLTVEVVGKNAGDRGGIPMRVDDHLQVVEAFRVPPAFDQDRVSVFNTNTFWIDVDAVRRPPELTWFMVRKQVGDRVAVQFERLVGELTAFVPTAFIQVPRDGLMGRFVPVKTPADLASGRSALLAAWRGSEGGS